MYTISGRHRAADALFIRALPQNSHSGSIPTHMRGDSRLITQSALQTRELGRTLGKTLGPGDVVAITGPLGVGKTVFAQGVADSLGIEDIITSPTFTIMNEYPGRVPFYHLDLYRLGSPDEFVWLGLEEMLNGKGVSVIEWGERAKEELPARTLGVLMEFIDSEQRSIAITGVGIRR